MVSADERLDAVINFTNEAGLLEVLYAHGFALDRSVAHLTDFLTLKFWPLRIVEPQEEFLNRVEVFEVDKGVSNIAVVVEVDRQVEEIILSVKKLVDVVHHHFLGVLVRNVRDLQRGPLQLGNLAQVDAKIGGIHLAALLVARLFVGLLAVELGVGHDLVLRHKHVDEVIIAVFGNFVVSW